MTMKCGFSDRKYYGDKGYGDWFCLLAPTKLCTGEYDVRKVCPFWGATFYKPGEAPL